MCVCSFAHKDQMGMDKWIGCIIILSKEIHYHSNCPEIITNGKTEGKAKSFFTTEWGEEIQLWLCPRTLSCEPLLWLHLTSLEQHVVPLTDEVEWLNPHSTEKEQALPCILHIPFSHHAGSGPPGHFSVLPTLFFVLLVEVEISTSKPDPGIPFPLLPNLMSQNKGVCFSPPFTMAFQSPCFWNFCSSLPSS